jgi:hypothetical protein
MCYANIADRFLRNSCPRVISDRKRHEGHEDDSHGAAGL